MRQKYHRSVGLLAVRPLQRPLRAFTLHWDSFPVCLFQIWLANGVKGFDLDIWHLSISQFHVVYLFPHLVCRGLNLGNIKSWDQRPRPHPCGLFESRARWVSRPKDLNIKPSPGQIYYINVSANPALWGGWIAGSSRLSSPWSVLKSCHNCCGV